METTAPPAPPARTGAEYTIYQRAYLAHWLTAAGRAEETLSRAIAGAKVDMNPHQVEAALFALHSPLAKGVILADEVGLGKTIEAGLVIAQRWAERKRRILLIVPATLRKQWVQELWDKFDLSACILEARNFNRERREEIANPFGRAGEVVVCSYEFAARKSTELAAVAWDLVVFDEAHRLRNIYRKSGNKIAKALDEALRQRHKILLTATPLQNTLMELYGLVSVIDPHLFGSEASFRAQYATARADETRLAQLKGRMARIAKRTLRRQVQEAGGINFTNRYSLTEDFRPTAEEERLYHAVSDYLRRDDLHAIRPGARHLVTLVLRKILASSSFAIEATLETMIGRLESRHAVAEEALADFETADELADALGEEEMPNPGEDQVSLEALRAEIEELRGYRELAARIQRNAKGEALLKVLNKAFEMAENLGGRRKAVIFTESRRTQAYLKELLEANGYAGELVLLNGTNDDPDSRRVYAQWQERHAGSSRISGSRSADTKAAVVEEFRDRATLLLSTEAGAEGVNLQFCSLLVNYDLPWNPQRVEQRIGRVHRYGQQHDVVVVNFLNQGNRADQLVFELLDKKFKLFEGVFGASDEILGAIESGVDIEQRIHAIYQRCRDPEAIEAAFAHLRRELEEILTLEEQNTRRAVLENFDADVVRNLRTRSGAVSHQLGEYHDHLLCLARAELPDARFDDTCFLHRGRRYDLEWQAAEAHDGEFFRARDGLGRELIERAKGRELPAAVLRLRYHELPLHYSDLRPLIGRSGHLEAVLLHIDGAESEERVVLSACTDDGEPLAPEQCARLLRVPACAEAGDVEPDGGRLEGLRRRQIEQHLQMAERRNENLFQEESEKLERWAQDQREAMELEIQAQDRTIREAKRALRDLPTLADKAKAKRDIKQMEAERDRRMMAFYEERKKIEQREDQLLEQVEALLALDHRVTPLFTLRWTLVEEEGP